MGTAVCKFVSVVERTVQPGGCALHVASHITYFDRRNSVAGHTVRSVMCKEVTGSAGSRDVLSSEVLQITS